MADVAPWTALQRAPFASQRYHWNAYFIAPEPVHVPVCAVSRRPTADVPATLGLVVAIGPVPVAAPAVGTAAIAAIAASRASVVGLVRMSSEFDAGRRLLAWVRAAAGQ